MPRFQKWICSSVVFAAAAFAQPVINPDGIQNGASQAVPGLPNSGIAEGSIFVVKGRGLGPACGPDNSQIVLQTSAYPVPTQLGTAPATTSIQITPSGGQPVQALMIYRVTCRPSNLPDQLAAVLPSSVPVGPATMTVTYNGQTSAAVPFQVVKSNFGIFTLNQAGSGPAIVTDDTKYERNTLTNSAQPNKTMVIWGTGLGPVNYDETRGSPGGDMKDLDVQVLVGGKPAQLDYRGRTPTAAGLDQINFKVPPGIEGCYVPLQVRVNGTTSNFASISINSAGGNCSDPANPVTSADLDKAKAVGQLAVGTIYLSRTSTNLSVLGQIIQSNTDSASASFGRYQYGQLLQSQLGSLVTPSNSCYVFNFTGNNPSLRDPVQPVMLDAGAQLSITGPAGTKAIPQISKGVYSAQLGGGTTGIPGVPGGSQEPPFLLPGQYTVAGNGGADVGQFNVSLTIPAALTWNEQATLNTVNRAQDLPLTWNASGQTGTVIAYGASMTVPPQDGSQSTVGAAFYCTAPASVGHLTVPKEVLSALPASNTGALVPGGYLALGTSPGLTRFSASGLDFGTITYSDLNMITVNYQ